MFISDRSFDYYHLGNLFTKLKSSIVVAYQN